MKSKNNQIQEVSAQVPNSLNSIKDELQNLADKTSEAKKAAENNPLTSSGKPKSELKGAAKLTNQLKEVGIEARKRGVASCPNMEGGIENNKINVGANAALKGIEIGKRQSISKGKKRHGKEMSTAFLQKTKDNQIQEVSAQIPNSLNSIKDELQNLADKTSEAKKAAENNPLTSSGKPKFELKGAAKLTNQLKEVGIEAHDRGIVSCPNMEGGIENNKINVGANAALKGIEIGEQQSISKGKNAIEKGC